MKMNHRRSQNIAVLLIALSILAFIPSCEEIFPPYSIPQNVLTGSMKIRDLDTVVVIHYEEFDFYVTTSAITLDIDVINKYDDLLQGEALIGDRITLQAFGKTPAVIVVPLTLGSLRTPSVFRGSLALPPNDTARFRLGFLPMDKKNIPVYVGSDFVQVDSSKIYGPIEFIASADVRLFERVQPFAIGNYRFKVYFKEYTK